jgi:HSP20 family protein
MKLEAIGTRLSGAGVRGSIEREASMVYLTTPTAPVFGLWRQIDRLFEDSVGRGQAARNEWVPAVDIRETNQELTFAVELPGIKPEDVEVTAVDGILTIRGERNEERRDGDEGRYHLIERNYGSFMRRFQLPQGVDDEKIEADVAEGMLQVRIPKTALPQPKKIQVRAAVETSPRAQAIGRGESRQDSPKKVAGAHQSK